MSGGVKTIEEKIEELPILSLGVPHPVLVQLMKRAESNPEIDVHAEVKMLYLQYQSVDGRHQAHIV